MQDIFINIADLSLSKKQNNQQTSGKIRKNMKPKKKWFDKECETLKTKANKLFLSTKTHGITHNETPIEISLRNTRRHME